MRTHAAPSIALILVSVVCACGPDAKPSDVPPGPSTMPSASAASSAAPTDAPSFAGGMSPNIAPGDDFYAFANGAWQASAQIPKDRSSWGVFAELAERTNKQNVDLIKGAAAGGSPEAKKVGTYFTAFTDDAGIEAKGLAPLAEPMKAIAAIGSKKDLARALGKTLRADVDILNATKLHTDNVLGVWVAEDLDSPQQAAAFLLQGGLGMPDRAYYLDPSDRYAAFRTKYQAHISAVLDLAKVKDATAKAARIFELEKKIAETHVARVDAADVEKGDNHWPRKMLDAKAPGLDWAAFLSGAKLEKQTEFVVWHPSAVTGLAALVQSQPLDVWKDYLAYHLVDHALLALPKAFQQEWFDFYQKTLSGLEEAPPRWKLGVIATNDALGEAVGKLYVEKYFPASSKDRAQQLVKNIIAAFGKRIDQLAWMAPATKAKAKAKLSTLQVGVGYPDKFRDYSAFDVKDGDAFGNATRAEIFEYDRNVAKLGKPIDRSEWVMVPQLVNAVNLPVRNAIQFPAAILQSPFFDATRPLAFDYGAIGSTIGHEISHSFDDEGSLFDETGKKQNWWTPEDLAHFKASGAALAGEFDKYQPFPDAHVNGKQTLGENIADVAGLSAAFDAYQIALGGAAAAPAGGYTGNQQFFISFGQTWRAKMRPEALRNRLQTDGHAPPEYRADTVRNLDAFYDAFNPKPGQGLYLAPNERVRVW